jgi:hypothetical protein
MVPTVGAVTPLKADPQTIPDSADDPPLFSVS